LPSQKNRTGIIYHSDYLKHDTGLHPENKERLISTVSYLKKIGMLERLDLIKPRRAQLNELQYIHHRDHIEKVRRCSEIKLQLDPDTILSTESYDVATLAAGGAITAVEFFRSRAASGTSCNTSSEYGILSF
jgi:acetoin utilization deacetylase AcuC-like enzyme